MNRLPLPMLPSNKKFGRFFAGLFAVAGTYAAWKSLIVWATLLYVIAGAFAVITITSPTWLSPLNKLWYRLGLLLGRVVSPIVLGAIFFVLITPVAVISRLFGRDVLLMNKRPAPTYWVVRNPVGPPPETFKNQF